MNANELVATWWFPHDAFVFKGIVLMKLGQLSLFSILPDSISIGFIKSATSESAINQVLYFFAIRYYLKK